MIENKTFRQNLFIKNMKKHKKIWEYFKFRNKILLK